MVRQAASTYRFSIDSYTAGRRLDRYLTSAISNVSRSRIQDLVAEELILVNGKPVQKSYRLSEGDMVEVTIPQPKPLSVEPEDIPLDIVYEDSDLIVVNKPAGMVVHPAPGHYSGTLVNALLYHIENLSGISGKLRPGIVHRLDKDTTGLLVVAKTDTAHQKLASLLKERKVKREYRTVVSGHVKEKCGTIDAPIGRHPISRKKMAVLSEGHFREAVTHYEVLEYLRDSTLLTVRLDTGRTHQIRVHMNYIGHPVVGDPVYGGQKRFSFSRQALHAYRLTFPHPRSGQGQEFTAPLPRDMAELIWRLREK